MLDLFLKKKYAGLIKMGNTEDTMNSENSSKQLLIRRIRVKGFQETPTMPKA